MLQVCRYQLALYYLPSHVLLLWTIILYYLPSHVLPLWTIILYYLPSHVLPLWTIILYYLPSHIFLLWTIILYHLPSHVFVLWTMRGQRFWSHHTALWFPRSFKLMKNLCCHNVMVDTILKFISLLSKLPVCCYIFYRFKQTWPKLLLRFQGQLMSLEVFQNTLRKIVTLKVTSKVLTWRISALRILNLPQWWKVIY